MESCKIGTTNEPIIENLDLLKQLGGNLPVVKNLAELIEELRKVFASDDVNIELVDYLMKSYKSNPADWKQYAKFDRFRYTRNLVDTGNDKYNLILLCWGEGHGSAIHDHADSHCFMKMLQGNLEEVRFGWPKAEGDKLEEISRCRLGHNEVCYINDSLGLHRVENTSHTEPAVSLHLYCPPYNMCSTFNQSTGQRSTCKVTFWSINGQRTKIYTEKDVEDN